MEGVWKLNYLPVDLASIEPAPGARFFRCSEIELRAASGGEFRRGESMGVLYIRPIRR